MKLIPTLDGRVKLKIPAETQTGKLFRMKGKGVRPARGGMQGDLMCRVVVETRETERKQKELLREFVNLDGERSQQHPESKTLL